VVEFHIAWRTVSVEDAYGSAATFGDIRGFRLRDHPDPDPGWGGAA
jgi:hypothetical protein